MNNRLNLMSIKVQAGFSVMNEILQLVALIDLPFRVLMKAVINELAVVQCHLLLIGIGTVFFSSDVLLWVLSFDRLRTV